MISFVIYSTLLHFMDNVIKTNYMEIQLPHPVYVLIEITKRKKNSACQNVFSMINPIKRFE